MFQFPLEPLLTRRKYLEEVLQKETADRRQQLEVARRRADALCRSLVATRGHLSSMQYDGAKAGDLQMSIRHLAHLEERISRQEEAVRQATNRVEQTRRDLLEAVKQRKVIEKLRERAEQAYHAENRRKEMTLINEIAVSRYNRNRKMER